MWRSAQSKTPEAQPRKVSNGVGEGVLKTMRKMTGVLLILLVMMASVGVAQQVYTNDRLEYTFELPSATWRSISEADASRSHIEFVYGDRLDGYLQVRKEVVEAGVTPDAMARREADLKLRYLPGFVEGKYEPFNGRLDGVTMSYEFVKAGKTMLGRNYYLQADNRTIYILKFSGLRDKLGRIRNQTDIMARSFKLK
jgi:hypothetical protein